MTQCFFIPPDEYHRRNDERMRLLKEESTKLGGMSWEDQCKLPQIQPLFSPQYFGVGAIWYCPWIFDPNDPEDQPRKGNDGYLSIHYWRDWADKRPPINVVCPGFREWIPDAKSTNGDGWTVTGSVPLITCSPSIVVPGYHGFLQNGIFTPNM